MTRIASTFAQCQARNEAALVGYITAGDPHPNQTVALMHSMAQNGCDIIELGVPFSDPMADGPVIQAAVERALAHGVTLKDVLAMVAAFRRENTHTPVVLMGYLNPIHRMGYAEFAQAAKAAGVDGVLTVDCPVEVAHELSGCLKAAQLDMIFLMAPTTTPERVTKIAQEAAGFVYYVSLKGVTGAGNLDTAAVEGTLKKLRETVRIPLGVGFGIRDEADAAKVARFADAVVIGSRLIQELTGHPGNEAAALGALVARLKHAVQGARA